MTFLKKDLRREYRILRRNVEQRELKEELINERMISFELFRKADCVCLYSAYDGEISTDRISAEAEKLGIRTAYPYCVDGNGIMEFYFSSLRDLTRGMYGINEPDIANSAKADFSSDSLCIVPGITFGKNGERLGYGKGYYDRFLETFPGKTVAIYFDECLSDAIPMEEQDRKIDYLITDRMIYKTL